MSRPDTILDSILGPQRRGSLAAGSAVILVVVVVSAGAVAFRGSDSGDGGGQTSASGTPLAMPAGTALVARMQTPKYATVSWAPDGAHLLVSSAYDSHVYDRFGRLVSQFGGPKGWLDAERLVGADGAVSPYEQSSSGGSNANGAVVANGHGSAAIVVDRPGCVGDPSVNWYRDGGYVQTHEKVTPFGWSPDGRLALLGHMDCTAEDAIAHGPKGPVQVVDFATGRVIATAPAVRGELAFSPALTALAAQSDTDLKIVDLAGGPVETLPGLRFLGWLDDESLYAASGSQIEFVGLDPPSVTPAASREWRAESPTGLHLAADLSGAARRIVAADGTTLMDLSSAGLVAERYHAANEPVTSALAPSWWSPDGRMLALESSDGESLVLLSVDPSKPGSL